MKSIITLGIFFFRQMIYTLLLPRLSYENNSVPSCIYFIIDNQNFPHILYLSVFLFGTMKTLACHLALSRGASCSRVLLQYVSTPSASVTRMTYQLGYNIITNLFILHSCILCEYLTPCHATPSLIVAFEDKRSID